MVLKFQITFEYKGNHYLEGAISENQCVIDLFIKCIDKTDNDDLMGGTLIPTQRISRDTRAGIDNIWVYSHVANTTHADIKKLATMIKEEFKNKSVRLELADYYFLELAEV